MAPSQEPTTPVSTQPEPVVSTTNVALDNITFAPVPPATTTAAVAPTPDPTKQLPPRVGVTPASLLPEVERTANSGIAFQRNLQFSTNSDLTLQPATTPTTPGQGNLSGFTTDPSLKLEPYTPPSQSTSTTPAVTTPVDPNAGNITFTTTTISPELAESLKYDPSKKQENSIFATNITPEDLANAEWSVSTDPNLIIHPMTDEEIYNMVNSPGFQLAELLSSGDANFSFSDLDGFQPDPQDRTYVLEADIALGNGVFVTSETAAEQSLNIIQTGNKIGTPDGLGTNPFGLHGDRLTSALIACALAEEQENKKNKDKNLEDESSSLTSDSIQSQEEAVRQVMSAHGIDKNASNVQLAFRGDPKDNPLNMVSKDQIILATQPKDAKKNAVVPPVA